MDSDKASPAAQTRLMDLVDGMRRRFGEHLRQELGDHPYTDIRRSELRLLVLIPSAGAPLTLLADLAGITKQSLSEFVERLKNAGYVTTTPNPHDRRVRLVHLTTRGETAQQRILHAGRAVEEAWREAVGTKQYESMKQTLATLADLPARATTASIRSRVTP